MNENKTLGQAAVLLQPGMVDNTHSAHEQMLESTKPYLDTIWSEINAKKDTDRFIGKDFYIECAVKQERLLNNVFPRMLPIARLSAATPNYDQILFKYTRATGSLDLIWVIPDKYTCILFKDNPLDVHPEEKQLLQYVLDFADGTLYNLCKQLNGEKIDSNILEEK